MNDLDTEPRCPECGGERVYATRTLLVRQELHDLGSMVAVLDPAGFGADELTDTLDSCDDLRWHCSDCDWDTEDPEDFRPNDNEEDA